MSKLSPLKITSRQPTKTNHQPEKWFRIFLWVVALIFASFLIGLGSKIVADLPSVSTDHMEIGDFVSDRSSYNKLKDDLKVAERQEQDINHEWEQKNHELSEQRTANHNARESFDNWLATRSVTEQSDQNPEVIKRTKELDDLKQKEQTLQNELSAIDKRQLDRRQAVETLRTQIDDMEMLAQDDFDKHLKKTELQVFIYRLLITLPLLILAWWLFRRYRHSNAWPFVWGFVFFAVFAFFVELVPYLPNYGGYVRYAVGIVMTVLIGRYGIIAMNNYLQKKREEESLSTTERQSQMNYDEAQSKIAKNICPSCERGLDFNNPDLDFCPHCGIHLFEYCTNCTIRKSTFNHYCFKCGTSGSSPLES